MTEYQILFTTLIISALSLLVGWFVYRLSKKGGIGKIKDEWTTPYRIETIDDKGQLKDLYCLIEGIFTNIGSKPVTLTALKGEGSRIVRTDRIVASEKITQHDYHPKPSIYILPNPINQYCSESTVEEVKQGNEIYLDSARLNLSISPGHSETLTICILFKGYKFEKRKGMNTVINFHCVFNNHQKSECNLLLDGDLIPSKIAYNDKGELPKGSNQANAADTKSRAAD